MLFPFSYLVPLLLKRSGPKSATLVAVLLPGTLLARFMSVTQVLPFHAMPGGKLIVNGVVPKFISTPEQIFRMERQAPQLLTRVEMPNLILQDASLARERGIGEFVFIIILQVVLSLGTTVTQARGKMRTALLSPISLLQSLRFLRQHPKRPTPQVLQTSTCLGRARAQARRGTRSSSDPPVPLRLHSLKAQPMPSMAP